MQAAGVAVDRRTALRAIGLLGMAAVLPACASSFAGTRLTLGSGAVEGGYFAVGTALAQAWQEQLQLDTPPRVLSTKGSIDNLRLLASGAADVVFSQVDVAADRLGRIAPGDPRMPRALARVYDDAVHVVVPAPSPIRGMGQLRGARVSLGDPDSGVLFTAERLLGAIGIDPDGDVAAARLGIGDSVEALANGRIDAFFWSGSLPTQGITALAARTPIRLLDLADVLDRVREAFPEYAPGTVPAGSYGIPERITTLLVRNVLLVGAAMADDLAAALVEAIFSAQELLAKASPAALTIDLRAAIGTQPVLLHPGAERFYRTRGNS